MARAVESEIVVVGTKAHPLRDAYHVLLTARWSTVLGLIAGAFLVANALFALLYMALGGIEGARPGSFADAFYFSVQTMGTIGYGTMSPRSDVANVLVVAESVVSLVFTALATGIVFARFSRTSDQIMFSNYACISLMDGVPTLSFRIGNDRDGTIYEAQVRVTVARTVRTKEGVTMYRMTDLNLVRDRSPALQRSFHVMHVMDESSLLHGATPESFNAEEVELIVTVVGTDGTSLQPVHARARYLPVDILWGSRLADTLSELADGRLQLDMMKFHDVVKMKPTASFPYPREAA
jgi:inward rectifier potassium channel